MAALPCNLTAAMNRLAQQAVGRDWQIYSMVVRHWPEIIGTNYAAQTKPVKLVFPYHGQRHHGVLTVCLPRGLAMAMQYALPQIMTRLHRFIGADIIARIQFSHAALTPPAKPLPPVLSVAQHAALQQAVSGLPDSELRESLLAFGVSLEQYHHANHETR
jgi:hypothetical protein